MSAGYRNQFVVLPFTIIGCGTGTKATQLKFEIKFHLDVLENQQVSAVKVCFMNPLLSNYSTSPSEWLVPWVFREILGIDQYAACEELTFWYYPRWAKTPPDLSATFVRNGHRTKLNEEWQKKAQTGRGDTVQIEVRDLRDAEAGDGDNCVGRLPVIVKLLEHDAKAVGNLADKIQDGVLQMGKGTQFEDMVVTCADGSMNEGTMALLEGVLAPVIETD